MRTGVWVACAALVVIVAFGVWSTGTMAGLSGKYVSAAEELLALTQMESWQRAGEAVSDYREQWDGASRWLQILVVHEELDAVDIALKRIQAGIRARDVSLCFEGCAELRENAEHLYHRDALTIGNIL